MKTTNNNQGHRPEQYENSAKFAAFGIVVLFIVIVILLAAKSCKAQTAYLVCVTEGRKVDCITTDSVEVAQRMLDSVFPHSGIDAKKELSQSVYLLMENNERSVYIERKRKTAKGKIRNIKAKAL